MQTLALTAASATYDKHTLHTSNDQCIKRPFVWHTISPDTELPTNVDVHHTHLLLALLLLFLVLVLVLLFLVLLVFLLRLNNNLLLGENCVAQGTGQPWQQNDSCRAAAGSVN